MSNLKAFVLDADYHEACLLVYAGSRDLARAMGARHEAFDDVDFIEIRARREKLADQWANDRGQPYIEADCDRMRDLGWFPLESGGLPCELCGLYDWSEGNEPDTTVCSFCERCGECDHADGCLWSLIETIVGHGDMLMYVPGKKPRVLPSSHDLADNYQYHWLHKDRNTNRRYQT